MYKIALLALALVAYVYADCRSVSVPSFTEYTCAGGGLFGAETSFSELFCNSVNSTRNFPASSPCSDTGFNNYCSTVDQSDVNFNWDLQCGGQDCTTDNFDDWVSARNDAFTDCQTETNANGGVLSKCCVQACVSSDCFCPTTCSGATDVAENDVAASEVDGQPLAGEAYCYNCCTKTNTKECCESASCKPATYANDGVDACCKECPGCGDAAASLGVFWM